MSSSSPVSTCARSPSHQLEANSLSTLEGTKTHWGDNYDDDDGDDDDDDGDDGDDDGHGMDDGRSASHDVNIRNGAGGENEKKEAEEASDQPHPLIFCTRPLSYICQPVNHSPSMVFLQDLALSPLFTFQSVDTPAPFLLFFHTPSILLTFCQIVIHISLICQITGICISL